MTPKPNLLECSSREDTLEKIQCLSKRSRLCNVYSEGPLILSDIPSDLKDGSNGAVLGIDEAGRGPLLGAMVYSAAFWSVQHEDTMDLKGFDDSKALTSDARSGIFNRIKETPELGACVRVLHASEISRNMFKATGPYNLNEMSHDAAITMIRTVADAGVRIERVYIDTVGSEKVYQNKLERIFQGSGIQFVVEKKADSKYTCCSAASIIAKVIRDELTANWTWSEPAFDPAKGENNGPLPYGSGYPSDPKCKMWLEQSLHDPVFCFPDFVRFSWGPAKEAVKKYGNLVEWEADDDEDTDGDAHQQTKLSDFNDSGRKRKRRFPIFEELGLSVVTNLVE